MQEQITIRLEVYLPFRGKRFWRGEERVAAGSTVADLIAALALPEPELAVVINGRNAPGHTVLTAGDEVAVLRHSEGG